MGKHTQAWDSAEHGKCWLRLAERMLGYNATPAERALRYSRHYLNGWTVEKILKPNDSFWEVIGAMRALHNEFYVNVMLMNLVEPEELSMIDYNGVMLYSKYKLTFTDMELDVLRAMHRNDFIMRKHKCDIPYLYVSQVFPMDRWLDENTPPQWVEDSDSVLQYVRTLFE